MEADTRTTRGGKEEQFTCPRSPKRTFRSKGALRTHTKILHDEAGRNAATCSVCHKMFACRAYLNVHTRTHLAAETRRVSCPTCGNNYYTKAALQKHVREVHELTEADKPHSCTYCGRKFWRSTDRDAHTRTHIGERPFKCPHPDCKARFTAKEGCGDHMKRLHSTERSHMCPETHCGKSFKTSSDLKAHLRIHDKQRPIYSCSHCDNVYTTKEGLVRHIRCKHEGDEKRHACTYCIKKFKTSRELLIHVRAHTGEKPYSCSMCPAKFVDRGILLGHEARMHGGEKRHKCGTCNKQFVTFVELRAHSEKHKPVEERQRSECKICGTKVRFLQQHMARHIPKEERQHSCTYCSKRFATPQELKGHARVHTGEKPHQCTECAKTYKHRVDLRKHMQTVHKMAPSFD